ncbi:MAG TPA: hypothetical protein VGS97_11385 [Actinocrinis sp.]|uniref:CIS tube protein n=1 Tax=Actinocrinis sp. TaxID=1920516 RepID=UPI002DDD1EA6|nr:hypothetical protein [Actinocrinis sp.]HEV2344688.1 hypothetical protein [Actinocrinis sp.]
MSTADDRADNARLGPKSGSDADYVVFQFNPAAIAISHTAPMQPSAGKGKPKEGDADKNASGTTTALSSVEEVAKANGVTNITVRSITFDGKDVMETCEKLVDWSYPQEVKKDPQVSKLPELNFVWGRTYLVSLNQVTVNYTRFSRTGKPVRASVDLTLHLIPKDLKATNPSSGGLSGRRSHLLTGPETLPELATRTYGEPGRWREIAAANRIEDPLRVRPGTLVYLPSEQEGGR